MSCHIAFIGLGIMGKPMALNLLKAGHRLSVYARNKAAAQPLVNAGAVACDSPRSAAAQTDFVITILSDTPDVEEIILKDNTGIIHSARPGTLVIDMSSISPLATRNIAKQLHTAGINMLDAPVSGGETGAINGTLSIMAGGSAASFERALPLLKIMGQVIVHVGDHGAGQVAKACNQILVAQTIIGVAEAFEFARAAGVDLASIRKALLGGFAYSRILELHGERMLNDNYKPGFKAGLHLKDMNNAMNAAAAMKINLPGAEKARQYLQELVDSGDSDLDSAALAKIIRVQAHKPD